MFMKKHFLNFTALSLAASMLLGVTAVQANEVKPFNDTGSNHQNIKAINYLKDKKIIEGYKDGTFKPAANINRAEFIKVAVLMLDDAQKKVDSCVTAKNTDKDGNVYFKDVPKTEWFAKYVCVAKDAGLVQGYKDGTYRPNKKISFAEASKVVLEVFKYKEAVNSDKWYRQHVLRMEKLGAIPKTIKSPHYEITRGDMAELIWRIKTGQKNLNSRKANDLEANIAEVTAENKTTEVALEKPETRASVAYPKFDSCVDFENTLAKKFKDSNRFYGTGAPVALPMAERQIDSAADMAVEKSAVSNESGEFSATNIQVAGVDEADVIKNDGDYIYMVKGDTVRIVKATPVKNMVELSKISFGDKEFDPSEIYVYGDKMVVLGNSWKRLAAAKEARKLLPYEHNRNQTKVYVVDIKDRKNPKEIREVAVDGSYKTSRRIGDHAYLVLNQYQDYYVYADSMKGEDFLPRISDSAVQKGSVEPIVACDEVHYLPGYRSFNYLMVVGVPLDSASGDVKSEVILGNSENVYASAKNLYVASTEWPNHYWGGPVPEPLVDPIPVEPNGGIGDGATPLPATAADSSNDVVIGEEQPARDLTEKTIVYKFAIDKGNVDFKVRGTVPGTILNQFSMDEHKDYFRIATTKNPQWRRGAVEQKETNNLYVLNEKLEIVGKVEDIAPGERIFSTRFMGDRGYMVTFKKVDPLFVFDLKDPKNPKILGKLKIPGFSDYLHPYDENHIIGFGKDAVEAKNRDFAWYQGMKMAIFDITNVEEPKEKFVKIIGDRGTDSELLRNHKALLFDKQKNLLAFPISVAKLSDAQKAKNNGSAYGEIVFRGAHVYTVDLKNGFKLRGEVTHYDGDRGAEWKKKAGDHFYGTPGLEIERMIYIGDALYSISEDLIKALDMTNVKELNKVELK